MDRRGFLQRTGILSGGFGLVQAGLPGAQNAIGTQWRSFEITTQIEVLKPVGTTRLWTPVALPEEMPFQKAVRNTIHCQYGTARMIKASRGADLIAAEFPPGARPILTITSQVKTRNWTIDLSTGDKRRVNRAELKAYLQPTQMLPVDGIVKERATEITKGARTDVEKARRIYDWIVENTYRNPKTRGCGTGDIRFMLESGDLGGKCADLNALYVGLARAAGVPARDLYGIRLARSQSGCSSLGVKSEDVTKAQHCRAEVYLSDYGWVPVDPADVRKVMLEEPPGPRPLQDDLVKNVRARLFGSWEMNWMAYNYVQDVRLPNASGPPVHFLMYPQAETAEGRLDSLDPDHFQYRITSRERTP